MHKAFAIALLSLYLSACGGGDSSGASTPSASPAPGDSTPSTSTTDAVTTASTAVATQIGATEVSGTTATTQAYDLIADIGDTWRILLNQDGSYTIKVLSTQYGLTDTSGTYSQITKGNFVVLTEANGRFVLTLDKRTKTIAGTVKLAGKTSAVAGSGYAVPTDTSKLAGDYVYFGSTRNAANGASSAAMGGSFRIAANGTDMTLCDGGLVNANGTCNTIAGVQNVTRMTLTLARNNADGLTHVKNGTNDFGILGVQAGDRGAVLVIDRFGYNQATPTVLRTGALYGVKQQALGGNEANGTWECINRGTAFATIVVNGTTMKVTDTTTGNIWEEKFSYNTALGTAANGFITIAATGQALADGSLFLPLSSSLAVLDLDATDSAGICYIKN